VVSFFKERSASAVFWVIIISIVLHAFFLVTPPAIAAAPGDGLLYYVLSPFSNLPPVALSIIYFAIIIVQALRINYVMNDTRMFQKATFTTALAYILLTALLPYWSNITPALVANSFIIWLLFRIVKLNSGNQPKAHIYNIGIISGGTILLYYPALGIIPVVFIALGVTRAFRINEWLVLLLGIITPVYFWCCYLFLNDELNTVKIFTEIFHWHTINGPVKSLSVAFGAAGLLLISGIYGWQANSSRMVIQVRKIWSVLFLMLLFFLPGVFLIKNAWPNALLLACVPASAFAANAFLYSKRIISALFFWLLVGAMVYVYWVAI
jgi:hypothetical protein